MKIEFVPKHPVIESVGKLTIWAFGFLSVFGRFFPSGEDQPVMLLFGGMLLLLIGIYGSFVAVRKVVFLDEKLIVHRIMSTQEIRYQDVTDVSHTALRSDKRVCSLGNLTNQSAYDQIVGQLLDSRKLSPAQITGSMDKARELNVRYALIFGIGGYLLSWLALWAGWLKDVPPELIRPLQIAFIATAVGFSQVYGRK